MGKITSRNSLTIGRKILETISSTRPWTAIAKPLSCGTSSPDKNAPEVVSPVRNTRSLYVKLISTHQRLHEDQ